MLTIPLMCTETGFPHLFQGHLFTICYLSLDSCALWDIVHRCVALSENSSKEMDSQFPFNRTISIKLFQKELYDKSL